MLTNDIRDLDRRAVLLSVDVVAGVTTADLRRPTPCAGWTLGDLLAHMTAQHLGFAAAARGLGADPEVWRVHVAGEKAARAYAEAAEEVIDAFAADGVLGRSFTLPELGPGEPAFPAGTAIGFHFIDYLVHGWDVARSLGVPYVPEPDLVAAGWPIAETVPDGEERRRPGAAFAPAVPADALGFERLLARLGRNPF